MIKHSAIPYCRWMPWGSRGSPPPEPRFVMDKRAGKSHTWPSAWVSRFCHFPTLNCQLSHKSIAFMPQFKTKRVLMLTTPEEISTKSNKLVFSIRVSQILFESLDDERINKIKFPTQFFFCDIYTIFYFLNIPPSSHIYHAIVTREQSPPLLEKIYTYIKIFKLYT